MCIWQRMNIYLCIRVYVSKISNSQFYYKCKIWPKGMFPWKPVHAQYSIYILIYLHTYDMAMCQKYIHMPCKYYVINLYTFWSILNFLLIVFYYLSSLLSDLAVKIKLVSKEVLKFALLFHWKGCYIEMGINRCSINRFFLSIFMGKLWNLKYHKKTLFWLAKFSI